jgi:hypothetical protein
MVMLDTDDVRAAQREAWARCAAINPAAAAVRPDPLRIPPNAATRATERWEAALTAGDVNALPSLYDSAYRSEDRRRLFRVTVDLDGSLRNGRHLIEGGWRPVRTILATAGDRLSFQHIVWTTGQSGADSEVETLMLHEVDREGRFVFSAIFDPEDRDAARAELLERCVAQGGLPPVAIELARAWDEHDLERLRAVLPADFYHNDHRRTGVGRLEGADAYLASIAALWELSRDLRVEMLYVIAAASYGGLYVGRWFGTNAEGGDFDAVRVCIWLARGEQLTGLEVFELEDLDVARARFEALGAMATPD